MLVAVSGGKDSLALWAVLDDLGYKTQGLHLNMGMHEFSQASRQAISQFAENRGLTWTEYSLHKEFGYSLPQIYNLLRNKICSVCGRLKRQFLNRLAARQGYTCLATGHNLDDEAGRLLGNLLGDRQDFVRRQAPGLPAPHPRIPCKVKPLYRLETKEILTYCRLQDILPAQHKCPLSRGATSLAFQEALQLLEEKMPGTKRAFLFSYLRKPKELQMESSFQDCQVCGEPAYNQICPVCSLQRRLQDKNCKLSARTDPRSKRRSRHPK